MKKYSKFLIQIALVLLFVVPLTLHSVHGAWTYYEGKVNSVSTLINNIKLAKFQYGPVEVPDYDHDFGDGTISDQDNQNAFEQIMGDKKDTEGDYDNSVDKGLNNPNSAINDILNQNLGLGDVVSSIDASPADNQGDLNRQALDPKLSRSVSFLMVKETSGSTYRTYNLYTTSTPLFSAGSNGENDYINGEPLFKMGDIIPEVYKAELKYDENFGYGKYQIIKSEKGYCRAGSIKSNPGLPFINSDFTLWTHGANNGIEVTGPEPHIFDFGKSYQLSANTSGPGQNISWVSSDTNVATVDSNGFVTVTNDKLNYNSKSVDIKAVSGNQSGTYSFKIDLEKLDSERTMWQGITLSQDGKTIINHMCRTANKGDKGTLYTSDFLPQAFWYYTDGSKRNVKFSITSKDPKIRVKVQYLKGSGDKASDIVTYKPEQIKKEPGSKEGEVIYTFKSTNVTQYTITINSTLSCEYHFY